MRLRTLWAAFDRGPRLRFWLVLAIDALLLIALGCWLYWWPTLTTPENGPPFDVPIVDRWYLEDSEPPLTIHLTLNRDGRLFLSFTPAEPATFPTLLERWLSDHAAYRRVRGESPYRTISEDGYAHDLCVSLRVDRSTPWSAVSPLLRNVAEHSIGEIAFVASNRRTWFHRDRTRRYLSLVGPSETREYRWRFVSIAIRVSPSGAVVYHLGDRQLRSTEAIPELLNEIVRRHEFEEGGLCAQIRPGGPLPDRRGRRMRNRSNRAPRTRSLRLGPPRCSPDPGDAAAGRGRAAPLIAGPLCPPLGHWFAGGKGMVGGTGLEPVRARPPLRTGACFARVQCHMGG